MKDCRTASLLHDLACLNVIYYLVSPINDVRLIRLPIFKEDRIVHESELAYGVKTQAVLWSLKTLPNGIQPESQDTFSRGGSPLKGLDLDFLGEFKTPKKWGKLKPRYLQDQLACAALSN